MKILVVTGASGGHIFPALAFLDTLKNKHPDVEILLVLPKENVKHRLVNPGYKVRYISISPLKLSFGFRNIVALFRFFKAAIESLLIVFKFNPDIVAGFGSIVSLPLVISAGILGKKTLIHEQNVVPGRANRFLAKFSAKIAVSFSETKGYFKPQEKKIILTGNPLRAGLISYDKDKACEFFGFKSRNFTILVMGGSLGSRRINEEFLRAVSGLCGKENLQIIHLSGGRDYDFLRDRYKGLSLNLKLFAFFEDMQYAYSAADLVISRAGATTISEIIFYQLPAILIPYPFAYQHQLNNARVLEKTGSAVIIQDAELKQARLKNTLEDFIAHPEKCRAMRAHYGKILTGPCANGSTTPIRLTSFAQGCPERSRRTLTMALKRGQSANDLLVDALF